MLAKCHNCNTQFTHHPGFLERRITQDPDSLLIEVGIECPKCKKWYHSYYLTEALQAMRDELISRQQALKNSTVRTARGTEVPITARAAKKWEALAKYQREYQTLYQETQERYRQELGTQVPQVATPEAGKEKPIES